MESRRSFLKLAGFSFAAGALSGCSRGEEHKALPFLDKPEEIIPGRANYYASLCAGCSAGCGVWMKNRDGRPIKVEGNPEHPMSRGGVCAVGQATVLSLYDSRRLSGPLADGRAASWAARSARTRRGIGSRSSGAPAWSMSSRNADRRPVRFLGAREALGP